MPNFMIVVDDGGELKSVTAAAFGAALERLLDSVRERPKGPDLVEEALNAILDDVAIAAGEYDPSDNDTPMVFSVDALSDDTDFSHDDEIEERHCELRGQTDGQ